MSCRNLAYYIKKLAVDAYDSVLDALSVKIAGQDITLLQKTEGIDHPVSILASGTTITADGSDHALGAQSLSDTYSGVDYFFDLSLAAGSCTITIQGSNDGSTWTDVKFKVDDGSFVMSHTFNSGDDPVIITYRKTHDQARPVIGDDGSNDVTENLVSATRRIN